MTALDDLPIVNSFLGIDLKTGSLIVAAICVVHPLAYGCSFFMPMSYLIVTIWILVALFFAASLGLFFGVIHDDALLCHIWIWYSLVFIVVMLMMMIMLALVFTSRRQRNRVCIVILGLLWYILTIYFILVVNSHRQQLEKPPPASVLNIVDYAGGAIRSSLCVQEEATNNEVEYVTANTNMTLDNYSQEQF